MAGGAGERFWPQSRRARPKPLLRVVGGATLLEAALQRARRFAGADRTWLVCTRENAAALRAASGLPRGRVLVEPIGRNTAMALGFAAAHIAAREPGAVIASLSADHVIPDARALVAALHRAARAADASGALVTLGIEPRSAETGYGWIRLGPPASAAHPGLARVRRFVEKPELARARRMLRAGGHLWNAGIFVWRADAFLDELARRAPSLARPLAAYRRAPTAAALERAYRRAPSLPIDVALLERSDRVWTLPVSFRWNDVGTWASLAAELGVGAKRSCVVGGDALEIDAGGNLVWAGGGRLVSLVGVEGLAVIDAGDALLVARLDRSGDVRRVVAALRERGRSDLL
jgi:mannose-1-phosphate guanylyltransferase/mannose-6-phosphate isomerase